jgi:uncharacterized protein YggU (UPF0235/DUF167 family)
VAVRVQPQAPHDAVAGWRQGRLLVRVTAPPRGGRANAAALALVAAALGVPVSAVRLVAGARHRDKLLAVRGLDPDQVRARLGAAGARPP